MIDNSTAARVIAKLNVESKEGNIQWSSISNPRLPIRGDGLIDKVYQTQYKEKLLRLYKYKDKSWFDEDDFEPIERIRLEFVDDDGNADWDFPNVVGLWELYDTVRFQNSKVEDFFKEILKGDLPTNSFCHDFFTNSLFLERQKIYELQIKEFPLAVRQLLPKKHYCQGIT